MAAKTAKQVSLAATGMLAWQVAAASDVPWFGLLEVEASWNDQDNIVDLALATAYLGAEQAISDELEATVSVLYEQGDTPLEVDEAFLSWQLSGAQVQLGQGYLPFGSFANSAVNDPLTLELGEIRTTAAMITLQRDAWGVSTYLMSHREQTANTEITNQLGVSFSYSILSNLERDQLGIDLVGDLLNSAAFSDLQELYPQSSAGYAVSYQINAGSWCLSTEVLGFIDPIENVYTHEYARPQTQHAEIGYTYERAKFPLSYALGWQQSKQSQMLELPEQRYQISISTEMPAGAVISGEVFVDRFNNAESTGLLLSIAAEFN